MHESHFLRKWLFVKRVLPMLDVIEIEEKLETFLEDRGFSLVDFHVLGTTGAHIFRIFVERASGQPADLDDCSWLSPMLSVFLESLGVFTEDSTLEVSSPGLDRAIKKEKDFVRYAGKDVKVTVSIEGRKITFIGELVGLVEDAVAVKPFKVESKVLSAPGVYLQGEILRIPREFVLQVRLKPEV